MAIVSMNYSGRSVPEKIVRAREFITSLTGNPNFPTPSPSLAEIGTAADELEEAYNNARSGDRIKRQIMKDKEKTLDVLMSKLGAYIQDVSGGDPVKILSSSAGLRGDNTPGGLLSAPVGLLATVGTSEGVIECKWKPMKGARSYLVALAVDLTTNNLKIIGGSTSASFTITDQESGKKVVVRVAAINGAGQGPWSDPAVGMAG